MTIVACILLLFEQRYIDMYTFQYFRSEYDLFR